MYNYKSTGVDINRADEIIRNVSSGFSIKNFENFAGVFSSPLFKDYTFVSCTDGIGSKIIPLIDNNLPEIIASDLVAMNINDLATLGAQPMFFLDYIAANNLRGDIVQKTIENLNVILAKYSCALLGGEISELSSLIKENYFDIAGFMVGCYKKENFLDKAKTKKGDLIVAFKSNGVHSNGFSLIRKLFEDRKISKDTFLSTLSPTKIYYDIVALLNEKKLIKAAANITGGGIYGNLIRSINKNLSVSIDYSAIPKQEIFEILKNYIELPELYRVFNMGAGFCVICDKENTERVFSVAESYSPFLLGEIV